MLPVEVARREARRNEPPAPLFDTIQYRGVPLAVTDDHQLLGDDFIDELDRRIQALTPEDMLEGEGETEERPRS